MPRQSVEQVSVKKVSAAQVSDIDDMLATEEPLEIRLGYMAAGKRTVKSISVTMRTPGNDPELAVGFLYTEGIVKSVADIIFCKNMQATLMKTWC